MKFILSLFLLILLISSNLACNMDCNYSLCENGQISFKDSTGCYCIYEYDCYIVKIDYNKINTWENKIRYSQFDVNIINNGNENLKSILIGTDNTFKLRDNDSLWKMIKVQNTLILPTWQVGINSNSNFTFGIIVEGSNFPNFKILSVEY